MIDSRPFRLISGTANLPLAEKISQSSGIPLCRRTIKRFSDGEIFVQIEETVRSSDIYIIQPTCPPVNDNLMELLIMIDALKRSSVGNITVVMPYYGYSRQDRKVSPRTPISAKLVADLLTRAGVNRMVALDLHAGQIQGYFDIPFDNLYGLEVLCNHIGQQVIKDLVIVSPDAGGVLRARAFAQRLHANLAIIDKRRPRPNESAVMHIVGDVADYNCIIVDDMVDTAGTLCNAAAAIKAAGAKSVMAAITHGVLSGPAIERLAASRLDKLFITDTIPLSKEKQTQARIEVVSCAHLLGEAIKRIHQGDTLSTLFHQNDES
ncbi:MAG: ribose-phosphate pyrophosphokinase [Myxococcales bacterium]|jgi:ribose-phosphate pyrophosphokinase|nr:ribose-phosphate pyrophosphokinase [Myxococcales bacterium]